MITMTCFDYIISSFRLCQRRARIRSGAKTHFGAFGQCTLCDSKNPVTLPTHTEVLCIGKFWKIWNIWKIWKILENLEIFGKFWKILIFLENFNLFGKFEFFWKIWKILENFGKFGKFWEILKILENLEIFGKF